MKILIVVPKYNLSIEEDYTYNFPLGLAYISSVLKKEKYDVDCFNLNHYYGTIEELLEKALDLEKYDLVCTGGNTLAYPVLKKITNIIKNHETKPKLILGGPIITSEPKLMFEHLNPDIAVIGEGETTIIDLLKCIENKNDLNNIKGITYRDKDNNILITGAREQIKDIETIPYPDFEGMEFGKYLNNAHCNDSWVNQAFDYPRPYPLLGSRGCPFNCTFCWHPEKYRARSIEDIMKELQLMVKKYKINIITIYDDCFSANKDRLYEFCKQIKDLSKELSWNLKWSCQLLVNSVDGKMLKIMKDAGCDNISFGFESFSPIVLKSMRKPITPEQIDRALKETLKANMSILGNFIFGDVAETKETAKNTLEYWKSSSEVQQISLGFVQPYPGSELYDYCLRRGIIKDKLDYIQNHMGPDARINMTETMTNEDIAGLNKEILDLFRKHFEFVTPISLTLTDLKKRTYEFDFKCPFCNKVTHYKNCFIENKLTYGFHIICRNCHMRSVLVGHIKKFAYRYYTKTRALKDYYSRLKKRIKSKQI